MRVLTALSLAVVFAAGAAHASSIIVVDQTTGQLQSLVDNLPPQKTDPDVIDQGNNVLTSSPSIINLGAPAPAYEAPPPANDTAAAAAAKQMAPVVMRGGLIGGAFPPPPPVAAAPSEPALLDPNDAGTPAKRRALKEQARRLAEAAANGTPAATEAPDQPEIVQEPAK